MSLDKAQEEEGDSIDSVAPTLSALCTAINWHTVPHRGVSCFQWRTLRIVLDWFYQWEAAWKEGEAAIDPAPNQPSDRLPVYCLTATCGRYLRASLPSFKWKTTSATMLRRRRSKLRPATRAWAAVCSSRCLHRGHRLPGVPRFSLG